ncbi:ABC transporter substrate-binding protein [Intrasporangium sp. YIM S08009]|uniref:ABC transporter substrate-binding protein n=1 Tax=Intrasporangium zincisolvens TaxID=3080018 RepID=UPI002B062394|nr:ABC transporter substrate-binding protein [Intrasporangium sp. YIM S08009]
MKFASKLYASGAALATTAALGLVPAAAASAAPSAAPAAPAASTPRASASSTINQVISGVGTFTGSFTPTGFSNQNGALGVTGLVTGTLTRLDGTVVPVSQTVTTTVQNATTAGSCDILNLVLGPLHLNLLGLVVDLNQVVLNITAQSGAGNLLGNLLCAVAGLLDGNGVNGLAALLNRLLGL